MGPFKFISIVFTSTAGVITKTMKSLENIADIAEDTTAAMLKEQQVANADRLLKLQASLDEETS